MLGVHFRPSLFGNYVESYPAKGYSDLATVSATILHHTDLWCRTWSKRLADNGGFDRKSVAGRFRDAHYLFRLRAAVEDAKSEVAALPGSGD